MEDNVYIVSLSVELKAAKPGPLVVPDIPVLRKEYVKLHLENGKSLLVKQGLSSLEKLLSPHRFVRVHRSYIVTIEKISSFNSTHITIDNHKIPIGRLYKNEVEKVLKY